MTHEGAGLIDNCLRSVFAENPDIRVVVVDNASEDGSGELAARYENVEVIRLKRNKGFGVGCNIGITQAIGNGAEAVLLLNQDALLRDHAIATLTGVVARQPDIGILSPLHFTEDDTIIDPLFSKWLTEGNEQLLPDLLAGTKQDLYEVPFVNAACWLITKKCLDKIGGFDPLFFMYGEDEDFCRRARLHGLKVGIATTCRINHARTKKDRSETFRARVTWQANKYRSAMIGTLKDYSRPDWRCFVSVTGSIANWVFGELYRRNISGIAAVLVSAGSILPSLRTIIRHRHMCQEGKAFLPQSLVDAEAC